MRVENFTKRASKYFGSVGLVVLMFALFPSIGFSQYPCAPDCTLPGFTTSIGACGTDAVATPAFTNCANPYNVPTTAEGSMDSLTIDLSGQVCYDANGNPVTPANPQAGEIIAWSAFTVPPNSGTFGVNVTHASPISWAIYHVPDPAVAACDAADFTFAACGVGMAAADTVNVSAVGSLNTMGYYYMAVWNSGTGAGDNVLTDPPVAEAFPNCEEPVCNVSIDGYTVMDNFDNTYFLCVDFTGFNSAYTISDPAALDSLPTYGSGMAPDYPGTVCLGNPGDPMNTTITGTLCLLYNDDVPFTGASICAVSEPGCNTPDNLADCKAFVVAPPATNFTLECEDDCHVDLGATALDAIPAPYPDGVFVEGAVVGNNGCFTVSNITPGTTLQVTSSDIITPGTKPGGGAGFLITRLYCFTDQGMLPGTADDETECCTEEFWIDDPSVSNCPLSCNDVIQISLDQNCEAKITPDMMLEGNTNAACVYFLKLFDENGTEIGNPLSCDYVGQTIKAQVFSGINSCWGEIVLEDKIKPTIAECQASIGIGCNATEPFFDPVRDVGAADNCGLPLELIVLSNELVDMDCDEAYAATRTITYVLRDKKGNLSETCTYAINFERRALLCDDPDNGLMYPPNWNNAPGEMSELECIDADEDGFLDWDTDGDGYPDVSYTGAPTIDGNSIYPTSEGHCEVQATFVDTKIQVGDCSANFKLLRQWTVLNWCNSSEICQFYQIIKVVDDNAPITTSQIVDCFEVEIDNAFDCSASFDVPAPTVIFECNSYTWTVSYLPSTLVPGFDADPYDTSVCLQPEEYQTEGLFIPTGITRNSDDNTPITISGLPIGQTWIRYIVTDECGNVSEGASEIRVIENIAPTPVCDEHTTVTLTSQNKARVLAESFDDGSYDLCGYDVLYEVRRMSEPDSDFKTYIDFDCGDIGDGNMLVFRVTDRSGQSNICMVEASIWGVSNLAWDSTPADALGLMCGSDLSVDAHGSATATDDCGDPVVTSSDSGTLNDCGYGTITRTWTAVSADGKKTITHVQTIEIVSPLVNITWPSDFVEHNGCGADDDLSPDIPKFGRPSYTDSDCAMIAVTHDDQYFNFTEGACLKVVRTWTVIDWCDFNANSDNRQTFVQVIKVYDDVGPAANACGEIVEDVLISDCEKGVTINHTWTDVCNSEDELLITYAIDGGAVTVGGTIETSLTFGAHSIAWTAEDRCGNVSSCTQDINLTEDKEPTPYCLGGVVTVVMDNGSVEIWAEDFDRNSFDNCPDHVLDFTMRARGSDEALTPNYTFDCYDLGITEVEIHVTDPFGNSDFCITTMKIQSNGDVCDDVTNPPQGGALISGKVVTEYNEAVVDAMVMLENMGPATQTMKSTDSNGSYAFSDVATNADYEITADKNDDYINGVSTLDIVYIQRHILGLGFLDSPYKVIAADANNSETVSAADLVLLRKLILGLIDELPNSESWRFVDSDQSFNNQYRPWPYMDKLDLYGVQTDKIGNDFVAVKVGDVTGDAEPNELVTTEVRSSRQLELYAVNQVFTKGEIVTVPIKMSEAEALFGLQTTISFNQDVLAFDGFDSDNLDISKNNFGLHLNDRGIVSMSWNENEQTTVDKDDKLVEFSFRALKNGQLKGNLSFTSLLTKSEAYTTDYELLDLSLQLVDSDGSLANGLQLFQNKPNPFDNSSIIGFNIPKSGNVSLSIFDITGKKVIGINDEYTKGYHELTIQKSSLSGSGLYYYQIELEGERAMKKMLLIE